MTKATKSTVERLQGEAGDRTKLGYVIWWSLERTLRVAGEKVKDAFVKCGFTEEESPTACDAEIAFTRVHRNAHNHSLFSEWLIRKVFIGDEKIVYGIVKETIDKKKEDLDYRKEDKITLLRNTEDVKVENNTEQGLAIKKSYHDLKGKVDNYQLLTFLLNQVRTMDSLNLREMGGIYFLPIKHEERLLRIEKAFASVSSESTIFMLPIYKDDRAKKSLTMAFDETFQSELEGKTNELKKLAEAENTRDSTFNNRLEELKGMQSKVKAYEDLLNFKATEIRKKISDLSGETSKLAADGRLKRKVDMG